ncbi:MAG: hypothetical protein ACR2OH_09115 [Microthrixaceae bacterium]
MIDPTDPEPVVRRPPRRRPRRLRRRSVVVAIVAFATVFGSMAWAASTSSTSAALATGSVGADCQSAPISSEWIYSYDPSVPGYTINAVLLDGLQPPCLSKGIRVAVATPAGAEVANGAGFTPGAGTSALVPLSPAVDLSSPWVGQLAVVIHS